MQSTAKVKWHSGVRFDGIGKYGAPISMTDGSPTEGDALGHSPVELVLFGLMGCTGIDVVMILNKMRQEFDSIEIEAVGERADEHPRFFRRITVHYKCTGANLDPEKVKRAIELSQEKYCTVSQSLMREVELDKQIEINGSQVS